MSFFGKDLATHGSVEPGGEVADGVVIERRSLLWLSSAAVASVLTSSTILSAQAPGRQTPSKQQPNQRPGKLTFEAFLELVYPLAKRLVDSKGEDEQAYLMTLAAAMSRLQDPAAPLRKAMQAFRKNHQENGQRFPLMAMSIKLKPGRGFSHHDHLNYNGVIMGIEGEARVRNYDFVGETPAIDSGKTFEVRETRNDLILPGRISTLGRNRENVHDLIAGKQGARVLDVFTFFAKNATSRYLNVEAKPRDPDARIYEAAWKPRRR